MNRTKNILFLTALIPGLALLPLGLKADWILINDFEEFADGEDMEGYYPDWRGGGALPYFTVYSEDIANPDANKGYFVDWGDHAAGGSDTWVSIPLPSEDGSSTVTVPEGNFLSAYFRLYTEGDDNRWHFGTTNQYGVFEDSGTEYYLRGWSQHTTILRYSANEPLSAYSGAGYFDSIPSVPVNEFYWREFWMIVYNAVDPNEKQWRVYYRDPGEEITPLIVNPDSPRSLMDSRNVDPGPLTALVLSTNNTAADPNPREFFLVDDIYYRIGDPIVGDPRTGEEITVSWKSGELGGDTAMWGPFEILDAAGNVNTDNWMGWINVAGDPYVWSYAFESWCYINKDAIGNSGGWVFVSSPGGGMPDAADGSAMWGPFELFNTAGDVDTGDWMGWINVSADPYVWSYELESWCYINQSAIVNSGAWVYISL